MSTSDRMGIIEAEFEIPTSQLLIEVFFPFKSQVGRNGGSTPLFRDMDVF